MDLTPIVKTRGGKRLDENRQRTAQTKFGFTPERVVAAADAYMRGIARRIAAGLNPNVRLVASVFISRWDKAVLYGIRWEVETHLGQLKTTMHMDVLHCKTVAGALKELTVFAIIYNLVRLVILQSARLQQVHAARISFPDALRWLSTSSMSMPLSALLVNHARPYRVEPRVKKRRPKAFPFMITPRHELRRQLIQQMVGA